MELPKTLNILADEAIAYLSHYFSDEMGQILKAVGVQNLSLRTFGSQKVNDCDLQQAHVLLTRSTLSVDQQLLDKAPSLLFVGSCTSGIDHLDTTELEARDIAWAHALGCNATAVAEYVLLQVVRFCCQIGRSLEGLRIAVIGYGSVGQRVAQKLSLFGCQIQVVDPVKFDQGQTDVVLSNTDDQSRSTVGTVPVVDLTTALQSDVVTLHVPLSQTGAHPTWHMMGPEQLQQMPTTSLLINASRGAVLALDECLAWRQALTKNEQQSRYWVFDVFEGEPQVPAACLNHLMGATAHIAGHSQIGKEMGTRQVCEAWLEYCGLAQAMEKLALKSAEQCAEHSRKALVLSSPLQTSDWLTFLEEVLGLMASEQAFFSHLKAASEKPQLNSIGEAFVQRRRAYQPRLELGQIKVQDTALSPVDRLRLKGLGVLLC